MVMQRVIVWVPALIEQRNYKPCIFRQIKEKEATLIARRDQAFARNQ